MPEEETILAVGQVPALSMTKESKKKDKGEKKKKEEKKAKRNDEEKSKKRKRSEEEAPQEEAGEAVASPLEASEEQEDSLNHEGPVESRKEVRKRKKMEASWKEAGMSEEEIQAQLKALYAKRERKKLKKTGSSQQKQAAAEEEQAATDGTKPQKKGEHGVWVGNLSYFTTREQIKAHFQPCGEITRLHLPKASANKSVGYCYIDFTTPKEVEAALALSETYLDRRAILVKNASDFTVKEDAKTAKPETKLNTHPRVVAQPNRPTPTLFVGNLSFDVTRDQLKQFFGIFGKVMNVRLSQWEDSGRCKGYAFVDFEEVDSAKKAIARKQHSMDGRTLKVEFGSREAHERGRPWEYRNKAGTGALPSQQHAYRDQEE